MPSAPLGSDASCHHVLMCCDGRYLQHAAVFLASLAGHNPDERFNVVIATDDLTAEIKNRFERSFGKNPRIQLSFSPVLGAEIRDLPIHSTLTKEAWGRLWVEAYFPDTVDKVFYFDPDIVVTGPVGDLLDTELGDLLIGAVTIPGSVRTAVHGYDSRFGYFNSGVLVINMTRWRSVRPRDQMIAYTRAYPERVNDPDQDALNGCFYAERLALDYIWNTITPFFRDGAPLGLSTVDIARIRRDTRLVHFNGQSKPWLFMCNHPRKSDYLRFLRQTAWRDFRYPDLTPLNVVKKSLVMLLGDVRLGRMKQRILRLSKSSKL